MFIETRNNIEIENYKKLLKIMGSLSNLFADTNVPYLSYRLSENLFCRVFSAKNLSRSDVSADASVNKVGIGIKTFIENNGKTMQKIAEFNKDKKLYAGKSDVEIVKTISFLRNSRLDATRRIHGLSELVYHCITRKKEMILAYDTNMLDIKIDSVSNIEKRDNVIRFDDGINEYSFNLSKSTLYKRFITPNNTLEIPVNIIKDPFDALENLFRNFSEGLEYQKFGDIEQIYLPLYSDRDKNVPEKSQLNQWNAEGRPRNYNEVYIQIPAWIHQKFPTFFPPRDTPFNIELPNGEIMSAKVCQDGSKALMSNPNKALGKWLLRDVLNLREGEILTYEKLKIIGLDSVIISKLGTDKFAINFKKLGSFEKFKAETE